MNEMVWDFSEHERLQEIGYTKYLQETRNAIEVNLNILIPSCSVRDATMVLGRIAQICNMAREALKNESGIATLDAAIVLVALIVIAAVFAFILLTS